MNVRSSKDIRLRYDLGTTEIGRSQEATKTYHPSKALQSIQSLKPLKGKLLLEFYTFKTISMYLLSFT